jgi:FkbM family methyltransferase
MNNENLYQYIILTKSKKDFTNNRYNQIISLNKDLTYLLPATDHAFYAKQGLFEASLIEWCKQFCDSDSLFLDIGAHCGTYAITLSPHAKKVYAFEPTQLTYYALCGGVALSNARNIECLNIGLGNQEQSGKQILNIVSIDGGGNTIQKPLPSTKVLGAETIEVKTLDSLNLQDKISFIKIDAEGNELAILQGATNTIIRSGYPKILFESNKGDVNSSALFDYLRELGYEVFKVNNTSNMYITSRKTEAKR